MTKLSRIGICFAMVASILCSQQVYASPNRCNGVNNKRCEQVKITHIYTEADGDVLIQTSADETELVCSPTANIYIRLDTSKANAKYIYSALLTAYTTGQDVSIRIDDSESTCYVSYLVSE